MTSKQRSARRLFSSESVTEGHPDKICDAISDAILDALLTQDPLARVAVETLVTTGHVHVVGEISAGLRTDIAAVVRQKVIDIGYDSSQKGFDGATCGINVAIGTQSPDIAMGVEQSYDARVEGDSDPVAEQGAGDQGLMFGYAVSETPELMPLPIALAHRLARRLAEVRKSGILPYLRPDGKTQVTVEYSGSAPVRLDTVVISAQHAPDISLDELLEPDLQTHDPAKIQGAIAEVFDLRPGAIVWDLDLLRPIYAPTAAYGHYGRTDIDLPWERTDRVDQLKAAVQ